MRSTFRSLLRFAPLAVALLATEAFALTGAEYLKLRRQNPPDAFISFTQVHRSPDAFGGKVLELRGTVDGYVQRDSETAFVLGMSDGQMQMLTAPASDVQVVANPNKQLIRVLARVKEGTIGNVAQFEALGIALEGEISLAEKEEAARVPARPRPAPRPAASSPSPSRASFSSRSGGPQPPAGAGLSTLAAQSLSPEAQAIYPHYMAYIQRWNRRLPPDQADKITVSLLHFSQRYVVDPRLVVAMICAESDFRPHITSHKGAMGLGQIMPDEVRTLRITDPYDPIQNIYGAVRLLRGKLDRYNHSLLPAGRYTESQIKLALAAYNAGPGAVRKYGGVPPYKETQGYVKKVLTHYRRLCGS